MIPADRTHSQPRARRAQGKRRVIHFGKYELLSRINVGGMAELVKARDTTPPGDRLVAIKRILPHLCGDEHYKAMFMDEARVLAQLDHPSIIHAYEFGEIEGVPFIALELVAGQDAREVFHACLRQGQPLPIGQACYVIARVCEGLQHAHDQTDAQGRSLGIVHRDVSLQNILIGYDGAVKLTDFGIADSTGNVAQTEAGVIKGKFGYMSPEQVQGAELDRRSDVFGAGICLYELLTGERLFSGESDYKAVERVRNVAIAPPSQFNSQLPASLEHIVLKALARQPDDRYQSTNDLRRALQAFLADSRLFLEQADLADYMRALFAVESDSPPVPPARPGNVTAVQAMTAAVLHDPMDDEPTQVAVFGHRPRRPPGEEWSGLTGTGLAAFDHVPQVTGLQVDAEQGEVDAEPSPARRAASRRASPNVTARFAPSIAPAASPSGSAAARFAASGQTLRPQSLAAAPRISRVPAHTAQAAHAQLPLAEEAASELTANQLELEWDEPEPTTTRQELDDAPDAALMRTGNPQVSGAYAPAPVQPEPAREPEPATFAARSVVPASERGRLTEPNNMMGLPTLELPRSRALPIMPLLVAALFGLVAAASAVYVVRGRATGALRVETEPTTATVLVDGRRSATRRSPYLFSKLAVADKHTIVVESDGYASWSTTLSVAPNKTLELPVVRLEPHPEPVERPVPPPVPVVEVPAVEAEAAAPSVKESRAAKRTAAVEARRAAAQAKRASAQQAKREAAQAKRAATRSKPTERAEPTPTRSTAAASSAGTGTLRVNTRPWSQVTVDGKVIGTTPQMNISLSAGKHTVVLSNSEFGVKKSLTITIKAGEVVTKVLTLAQ